MNIDTDPIESLNIVSYYIRTQIPSCHCMAGLDLHISPLGSLVYVYLMIHDNKYLRKLFVFYTVVGAGIHFEKNKLSICICAGYLFVFV